MSRRAIHTPNAPSPIGPYSQAIAAGDLVFLAGQVGLDPATGKIVEGGVAAEMRRAIANLAAVLAAEGLGLGDVVKTTLYLADMADFGVVGAIYGEAFSKPYPARATVQVSALPGGGRVEIEAIAIRSAGAPRPS